VGLDVEARHRLWEQIRRLVSRGKTVVLTTHYLEEADALADWVVVIRHGAIIAEGTPSAVKARSAVKKIRCFTQLTADLIRGWPAVADVENDRSATVIHTYRPEDVLREMFRHDPEISGLEVTAAGLEEAFLSLTQPERN
jgi:ABC-2 type transport system ATP-binding protein